MQSEVDCWARDTTANSLHVCHRRHTERNVRSLLAGMRLYSMSESGSREIRCKDQEDRGSAGRRHHIKDEHADELEVSCEAISRLLNLDVGIEEVYRACLITASQW